MTLSYLPVHFVLHFAQPVFADTPPLFILRSMLGKNLHSMSCIAHQNQCPECMYNRTCAYAFLFETILPADNNVTPDRDRASHPFVFTSGTLRTGTEIREYNFTITLLGKAIDYLPYIYAAFVRAGKDGIFKSRTQFEVVGVEVDGTNILLDSEHLDTCVSPKLWQPDFECSDKKGEILVELKTPLRFKYGGKYGTDFSAQDFFACLYRRTKTLCTLYGDWDDSTEYNPTKEIEITERNLKWQDYCHYSARQKKAMNLGGALGTFKLSETFTAIEQNLLQFASFFNAGKNTNFGLGQLDFWTKWE